MLEICSWHSFADFFPDSKQSHFYLIMFNQKNPGFLIIDNTKTEIDIGNKYGELPAQLVRVYELITCDKLKIFINAITK